MTSPTRTIAIREADTIWQEQGGWFDARWHFSFDRYRDKQIVRDLMQDDQQVNRNLKGMDDLDFKGWNKADWDGVFARHHTEDVLVDWKGQKPTHGVQEHIDAMKAYVAAVGGTPPQITSHPISFGSGEWTCAVGVFEDGSRMVTVAKWRNGAIAEEYIWA